MIWGDVVVSRDGMSVLGTAVAADAPPASDKERPTMPTTGTASFRRFRFEACFRAIPESSALEVEFAG
jgi:hypothetical protein